MPSGKGTPKKYDLRKRSDKKSYTEGGVKTDGLVTKQKNNTKEKSALKGSPQKSQRCVGDRQVNSLGSHFHRLTLQDDVLGDRIDERTRGQPIDQEAIKDMVTKIKYCYKEKAPIVQHLYDNYFAFKHFDKNVPTSYQWWVVLERLGVNKFACSCERSRSLRKFGREAKCDHVVVVQASEIEEIYSRGKIRKALCIMDEFIYMLNPALKLYVMIKDDTGLDEVTMASQYRGSEKCYSCPRSKDICHHITELRAATGFVGPQASQQSTKTYVQLKSDGDSFEKSSDYTDDSGSNVESVSKKPIQIPLTIAQKYRFESRFRDILASRVLYPRYDADKVCTCEMQSKFQEGSPVDNKWIASTSAILLHRLGADTVNVYYRPTEKGCDCRDYYDGGDDFILNKNNKILVTHPRLLQILSILQSSRTTMTGMTLAYNIIDDFYLPKPILVAPKKIIESFKCFLKLLNCNTREIWRCKQCEAAPRIIVQCDGLQMSSSAKYVDIEDEADDNLSDDPTLHVGLTTETRRVLTKDTKKLLANYLGMVKLEKNKEGNYTKTDLEKMKDEVLKRIAKEKPKRDEFLKFIQSQPLLPSKKCITFLDEMARGGSTLTGCFQIRGDALVTSCLVRVCKGQAILNDENESGLRLVMEPCQPLTDLLAEEQDKYNGAVSPELADLVYFIIRSINAPVKPIHYEEVGPNDKANKRKLQIFPCHPVIRRLVRYRQDVKNKEVREGKKSSGRTAGNKHYFFRSLEKTKEEEKVEFAEENNTCKNDHATHRNLLPGLFVFSCGHRKIIGVMFMSETESVRYPFSVLAERFTKEQLRKTTLIFDNACKFYSYAMLRAPDLITQGMEFTEDTDASETTRGFHAITDNFHADTSHENCPTAFKYDHWKTEMQNAGIYKTNTSQAEQINAKLRNLEKILRSCKLSTAVLIVTGWITMHNMITSGMVRQLPEKRS